MYRALSWIAAIIALAACAPPAGTAVIAPPTAALSTATRFASATPSRAPTSPPTAAWTPTRPPASPTPQPIPTREVHCPAGQPWSGTQGGFALYLCADPQPPELGRPVAIEVTLTDAAGELISEAEVKLTLVGGMGGMEGEHDEDFSVQLEAGEAGRYGAATTIGPPDLVLTGMAITVQHQGRSVTFNITPDELRPETP